jgi:hypothetical protein
MLKPFLVYNPHLRQQSDEALMKQAKLQAMGLPVPDKNQRRNSDRPELATDEAVCGFYIRNKGLSQYFTGNGTIQEENEAIGGVFLTRPTDIRLKAYYNWDIFKLYILALLLKKWP